MQELLALAVHPFAAPACISQHRLPAPAHLPPTLWPTLPTDEGCYAGGNFLFEFRVPDSYPSDPPQVRALTQARRGTAQQMGWSGMHAA